MGVGEFVSRVTCFFVGHGPMYRVKYANDPRWFRVCVLCRKPPSPNHEIHGQKK